MDMDRIKQLAGVQPSKIVLNEKEFFDEAVEIPGDITFDHLEMMMDAARRALGLANKLRDPMEKRRHLSRVMTGLNKIRAALNRMINFETDVSQEVDQQVEPNGRMNSDFM